MTLEFSPQVEPSLPFRASSESFLAFYEAAALLEDVARLRQSAETIEERRLLLHQELGALAVLGSIIQQRHTDCIAQTITTNLELRQGQSNRGPLIEQLQPPSDMDDVRYSPDDRLDVPTPLVS